MRRLKRIVIPFSIAGGLAAGWLKWKMLLPVFILFASCAKKGESPKNSSPQKLIETAHTYPDFRCQFNFDSNEVRVIVNELAIKGDSSLKRILFRDGLQVQFLDHTGIQKCMIKAESGIFLLPFSEIDLMGGVLAKADDGYEIELENLNWKKGSDEVFSSGNVRVISPGVMYSGDSITASLDFSYFKIQNVSGVVELD